MKVFETIAEMKAWRKSLPQNQSVGFVPTMGALHRGHQSLLERARKENEILVLSIFVNPTQFNQASDFANYPKTWDTDLEIANLSRVDAIFAPKDPRSMYPDDYRYHVSEIKFSKELDGEFRPGHFQGMLTVVLKLFQITQPTRAYFGEKDHQQLTLVRGMIDAFFLDTELVPCTTVREKSGLALSSRNARLNSEEKELAPRLYETLMEVKDPAQAKYELSEYGFKVEYLEDRPAENGKTRRYAAAWLGDVRLIDNVSL
jgi:pantoate--beta-alanine ligase